MKRHELEEIIKEELHEMLSDLMAENFIMETLTVIDEKKKNRAKYTSSGTVPTRQNRKMTPAQVQDRKTLGREILRAVKWGNEDTNPVKRGFYKWAKKNDRPITSDNDLYSFVWAMASDYAIKGDELPAVIQRAAKGPMSTRGAMNLKKGPDRNKVARAKEKKKANAVARAAKKVRLAPKKAAEKEMKKKIQTPSTAKRTRTPKDPDQLGLKIPVGRPKPPAKKTKKSTKKAAPKTRAPKKSGWANWRKSAAEKGAQTDLFKQ
jgi:hypothetical protein